MHEGQAAAGARLGSRDLGEKMDGMIADALSGGGISESLASRVLELRTFLREVDLCSGSFARKADIIKSALAGSKAAFGCLASFFPGRKCCPRYAPEIVRSWLPSPITPPCLNAS